MRTSNALNVIRSAFPPIGLLESVFLLHFGDGVGSAFSVVVGESQYLITAHHVVPNAVPGSIVELAHMRGLMAMRVIYTSRPFPDLDVCMPRDWSGLTI